MNLVSMFSLIPDDKQTLDDSILSLMLSQIYEVHQTIFVGASRAQPLFNERKNFVQGKHL